MTIEFGALSLADLQPSLTDAPIAPRAYQHAVPVWVGVGGTPASAERAGCLGIPMVLGYIGGPLTRARQALDAYRRSGERAVIRRSSASGSQPTFARARTPPLGKSSPTTTSTCAPGRPEGGDSSWIGRASRRGHGPVRRSRLVPATSRSRRSSTPNGCSGDWTDSTDRSIGAACLVRWWRRPSRASPPRSHRRCDRPWRPDQCCPGTPGALPWTTRAPLVLLDELVRPALQAALVAWVVAPLGSEERPGEGVALRERLGSGADRSGRGHDRGPARLLRR